MTYALGKNTQYRPFSRAWGSKAILYCIELILRLILVNRIIDIVHTASHGHILVITTWRSRGYQHNLLRLVVSIWFYGTVRLSFSQSLWNTDIIQNMEYRYTRNFTKFSFCIPLK